MSEKTRMIADAEHGASGNKLYRVAASLAMALVLLCGLLWPFGSDSLTTTVPQLNALLSASRPTVNAAAPHDSGMTASSKGIKVTQVDGVWVATRNDFDATGVYKNEYGWWRVEDGKVNFKANGIYKNDYGWWKTTDGKVTFDETGVFKNDYGWWRVEKSKVNFKYSGKVKYNGKTYQVKEGKAKLA